MACARIHHDAVEVIHLKGRGHTLGRRPPPTLVGVVGGAEWAYARGGG